MKELRRNEFIDMLEMLEILYEAKDKFIKCDIPTLGAVTYFPKANKVQIDKSNEWVEHGFEYVKSILNSTTKQPLIYENTSLVKIKEVKSDAEFRDECAMRAMQGIMASGHAIPAKQHQFDNIAEDAYRLADAMVKQRKL